MHPCLKKCMARAGIVESWVRGISILEMDSFTATSAGIVSGSEKHVMWKHVMWATKNPRVDFLFFCYTCWGDFTFTVTSARVILQRENRVGSRWSWAVRGRRARGGWHVFFFLNIRGLAKE